MPMPLAFLLSLQASGMVVDWLGKNEQVRLGKMGSDIEQEGINANIQSARLESEQSSLDAMKQLRMNMGTQAAILAARGTRAGAGSAASATNQSISNFNADERTRRMNLLSKEGALRAQRTISQLHEDTNKSTQWNSFRSNVMKTLPTTPDAYNQYAKAFGLTKI